ncbi:chromate transporter [Kaistia soli DSM 19436]|uniref:Chromate transporter n=1 Tax=Kaistia soli DSM 19436 TaxID=1122133 RepID=A0A1M5JGF1_9HYPH|nr:chromate efflux transporter [Kaistia soli]SHG39666.1 chromate transporter [Kaistia soli DSM 19436]
MRDPHQAASTTAPGALTIFLAFLRLGLTAFGGPVAHLGYFRDAFVIRLGWIEEPAYADLVALCQFLPGPTSSQVSMGIGYEKRGLSGALAAFAGFTLPSGLIMAGLGMALSGGAEIDRGLLGGLALVAVAVVAEAVRGMAGSLAANRRTGAVAVVTAALALVFPGSLTQLAAILAAALLGTLVPLAELSPSRPREAIGSRGLAFGALAVFVLLLAGLPLAASVTGSPVFALADAFYRAGALVFGGGHVVLPLLERSVVAFGFVPAESFVAGYGAAQAMPGPLFSIASFLGAVAAVPNAMAGALLATLALFAPGFLLIVGVLPFWRRIGGYQPMRRALVGVNAAVVGLLAAALYDPVFRTAVHRPGDAAFALAAWGLLTLARWPAWSVVILGALAGLTLERLDGGIGAAVSLVGG